MKTTQQDILDAIRAAMGPIPDDPGLSAHEYAEAENVTLVAARGRLERGVRTGKLLKGAARRQLADGRHGTVPVYRVAGT